MTLTEKKAYKELLNTTPTTIHQHSHHLIPFLDPPCLATDLVLDSSTTIRSSITIFSILMATIIIRSTPISLRTTTTTIQAVIGPNQRGVATIVMDLQRQFVKKQVLRLMEPQFARLRLRLWTNLATNKLKKRLELCDDFHQCIFVLSMLQSLYQIRDETEYSESGNNDKHRKTRHNIYVTPLKPLLVCYFCSVARGDAGGVVRGGECCD